MGSPQFGPEYAQQDRDCLIIFLGGGFGGGSLSLGAHSLSFHFHCRCTGRKGPLCRLLEGHASCTTFSVGYQQTLCLLATLTPEVRRCWQDMRQNQGPIQLARRWLARQGWDTTTPWLWVHSSTSLQLDARDGPRRPTVGYHTTHAPGNKTAIAHCLREGWRADQWHNFCQSGTRAAAALGHMAWTDVAARAKAAAAQWRQQAPLLRPHVIAITVDHWVSQARLASNGGQQVMPCHWCGHDSPSRTHEWTCTQLRTSDAPFPDTLFATLGWPRPGNESDTKLLTELAQIRLCILQQRYPPA